ncbi:hypothetical protein BJV74DRAFT_51280 [Russula compacta]|nr:hypothetical protein BJV74DRAFT_51280 [Russula compacta]
MPSSLPRTPSSSSPYRPHTSSPLYESFSPSPSTSAAAKLQSRRLAQYKSSTTPTRRVSSAYHSCPKHAAANEPHFGASLFSSVASLGDAGNPRNKLLRDRLRQRCARQAQQERTKRVERERRRNGLSSDGDDMSMESDEENDEELVLNDELFRRIIASASHKQQYSYRLSFQHEVGSSIDPDMEDVAEWERILQEGGTHPGDEPDLPPSEFDEDYIVELATQAEEAELWADFDDADTIFSFSDINDIDVTVRATLDDDVRMA